MKTNSNYTEAASKAGRIPYTSFHLADSWSLLTSYTEYNDHSRDAGDSVFLRPAFAGDGSCIPNTIKSFRSGSRKSSNDHRIPYTMIFSEDSSGSMTEPEMLQGFRWYSVYLISTYLGDSDRTGPVQDHCIQYTKTPRFLVPSQFTEFQWVMEITKNVSFSRFVLKRKLSRHNPARSSVTVKIMYSVYEMFSGAQSELVRHQSVRPEPGLEGRRIRYTMTAAGTAGWSVVPTQPGHPRPPDTKRKFIFPRRTHSLMTTKSTGCRSRYSVYWIPSDEHLELCRRKTSYSVYMILRRRVVAVALTRMALRIRCGHRIQYTSASVDPPVSTTPSPRSGCHRYHVSSIRDSPWIRIGQPLRLS